MEKVGEFKMEKIAEKVKIKKIRKSFLGAAKGIGAFTKEDKHWMEGKSY